MTLQKLKKASPHELRVRAAQKILALGERVGYPKLTKLPSDRVFHSANASVNQLEQFRVRSHPYFFASFQTPHETVAAFQSRFTHAVTGILIKADKICAGKFDLLGFHDLSFGDPVDWHLEPISGKRSPALHWSRLNYLDSDVVGDKKIIWELNRHQYFVTLGQAYWLTNEERYAETFVQHLNSWMDENPPKVGVNWASSLEVAFRSISWVWALHLFRNSPTLTENTFTRAVKFLYIHARHIESYLSTYFSPNTHLTGEALGLFYVGLLFPEFKEAERWKTLGASILIEQLPRHVQPDGVYFEQASYYHRYTTDFYLHFLILSRLNSLSLPGAVEQKLTALLEHLMYITRPDGSTPYFGDDDGGRLTKLDERAANDFRGTLATGAAVLSRGDFKFVAGDSCEELFWLLGIEGFRQYEAIEPVEPVHESKAFRHSGYFVMRDGWTPHSKYLLFDCGVHGTLNCGHAHADALSIDVAANGHPVLVDPGTYTYTGSEEWRDWFRSSPAHNTLVIDGKSSSTPNGPFSWKSVARTQADDWLALKNFDYVTGKHDGYEVLANPVFHTRSILFLKRNYWVIRDQLSTQGDHQAQLRFQFDASSRVELVQQHEDSFVREVNSAVEIQCFAAAQAAYGIEPSWISKCYGEKEAAPAVVFSLQLTSNQEIITFVIPQAISRRQTSEVKASGGRAFVIADRVDTDVVMIRTSDRIEYAQVSSDFEWLWIRFSNEEENRVSEFLGINGSMLSVGGRSVVEAPRRLAYFSARRTAQGVIIDSDGDLLDDRVSFSPFDETPASLATV